MCFSLLDGLEETHLKICSFFMKDFVELAYLLIQRGKVKVQNRWEKGFSIFDRLKLENFLFMLMLDLLF